MKTPIHSICLGLLFYGLILPVAEAHTFGAHGSGLAEGFVHPFVGLDHLLAMIAVGLWAAQLGGRAIWLAPVAFVAVMAGAALLGSVGTELPMLEPAIASSVLVLGLFVALAVRLSVSVSVSLVGLFALFHGYAHGLELPQTDSPALYGAGFMLATASLHGVGLALALSTRRYALVSRIGGSLIAMTGLLLLTSA
jgi:urease accessory protein